MAHPVRVRTADGWQDLALVGAQGPAGPTGPTGPTGPAGVAEVWHSGSGAPASGLGLPGDWYLNTANGIVFEKTDATTWVLRANIKGPQGDPGPTGSQGPVGSQGIQGIQGIQGPVGVAEQWWSSAGAPSGITGVIGDWHLNTANGDVSEKTGASTWTVRANITGPAGSTGPAGPQGASSDLFDYALDTNFLSGDPTSGEVRFSGSDQAITTGLQIHETTAVGQSAAAALMLLRSGDQILIQSKAVPGRWQLYTLTANPTDAGAFVSFPVGWADGGSDIGDEPIWVSLRVRGDAGVVDVYEQPGDPGAVEEGSIWIDTDSPPPAVSPAVQAYADMEVTVSTSAPVGAPSRDGILWVVVEP